jgi:hypothetical protein
MNETRDRCGPAARAAYRASRGGQLYLCGHCANQLRPALSGQAWALRPMAAPSVTPPGPASPAKPRNHRTTTGPPPHPAGRTTPQTPATEPARPRPATPWTCRSPVPRTPPALVPQEPAPGPPPLLAPPRGLPAPADAPLRCPHPVLPPHSPPAGRRQPSLAASTPGGGARSPPPPGGPSPRRGWSKTPGFRDSLPDGPAYGKAHASDHHHRQPSTRHPRPRGRRPTEPGRHSGSRRTGSSLMDRESPAKYRVGESRDL